MNQTKFWIKIRGSFWFIPAVYGVASFLLFALITTVDGWLVASFKDDIPQILLTTSKVAIDLYASLVTGILTMTTISFSVIMVVLTTYSTQFSPRTLQDFMKSRTTQHVLGVYCLGFIFALLHLLTAGKESAVIGPIIVVIVAIVNLAFFVYFIHHSARWIQVNNLIGKIRNDGALVIKKTYREPTFLAYEDWDKDELKELQSYNKRAIYAYDSGYIQKIEWAELMKQATSQGCILEVHAQVGDFVAKGLPIMSVIETEECRDNHQFKQFLVIGNERTDLDDVEFMLQKLVEIALRAISPAVNDPHTAINCLNRIGALLSEIGEVYHENKYFADHKKKLRVICKPKKFEEYLYISFYQIRHYGKSDVSIVYAMIEVLYNIAIVSKKSIKKKVWRFHYYIMDVVDWDRLSDLDRDHLQEIYKKFEAYCTTG
ncbi:hypothetical protein CFK37_03315 [Virgibacillus phasianinus]|uniref:DUF2254 domain-containing protein n=1 Tax=Virgibacillus phasianinus TaxID=2017483 RepID=A0A220U030_9BACI|nr:DUF2254 domain-containing protein [Virgibacillus phasianinus]ASK61276.1 hypothetical protein CFK37_03315 [Virgibacillus phasianinus]